MILAAKRLGFHTVTTGNMPTLIGHAYADEYHSADFSDREAILKLAESLGIDRVCSCANDFGAITAAYVAEQLDLGGHDSLETCLVVHHKDRFKQHASLIGLPTPAARAYSDPAGAIEEREAFRLPAMVKPIDLTGGKGITHVREPWEFEEAVRTAHERSPSGRIVIEEFFEGSQHSFSTFIVDQKVVFAFSDDELSYLNPFLVSTSAAPAVNIRQFESQLRDCAERFAQSLELVDGILHFQYLADDTKFTIIEITRRCSGDLYPIPVSLATGIDWAEWIVRAETGYDCHAFPGIRQAGYCGRHCIMSESNGVIDEIVISAELEDNIESRYIWSKPGDVIEDCMTFKAGVLILKYESRDEMAEKTARLNELVKITLRS